MSKNEFGFCSCFSCGLDEGPCVYDYQCNDNLFCGYKNCPVSFGNDDANCCGRNQFKSPNYPNEYFHDDIKTWLITAPVGTIINLQFQNFHVRHILESEINCWCLSKWAGPDTSKKYTFWRVYAPHEMQKICKQNT